MQPVVDGLEADYPDQVEFRRINASTVRGAEIFNAYNLFGHPSYILMDPSGQVLWQGTGEQPEEMIVIELKRHF